MSVKESPLAKVKRLHGSKETLVDTVVALLKGSNSESPEELKQRLQTSSNSKLLRLAEALRAVQDTYGSKDKLVQAISESRGKAKDQDYVNKLHTYPVTRLLDMAPRRKSA